MKHAHSMFSIALMTCLAMFCLAASASTGEDKRESASQPVPAEEAQGGNVTRKGLSASSDDKTALVRYFACRFGLLASLSIQQDESNRNGIEMLQQNMAETAIILEFQSRLLREHLFNTEVSTRQKMEFVKRVLPEMIEIRHGTLSRSAYEMGMYIGVAKAADNSHRRIFGNQEFLAKVIEHAIRAGEDSEVNNALMLRLKELKHTLLSATSAEDLRTVEPAYRGVFIEILTNKALFTGQ